MQSSSYYFEYFYGEVLTYRVDIKKNSLSLLRFKGEDSYLLDTASPESLGVFWDWFKSKIEYDNEALRLIICSNQAVFVPCNSLVIAKQHHDKKRILRSILSDKIKQKGVGLFRWYPHSAIAVDVMPSQSDAEDHSLVVNGGHKQAVVTPQTNKGSMSDYYCKKTAMIKRGR